MTKRENLLTGCKHIDVIEMCVANRLSLKDMEILWCKDCGALKLPKSKLWRNPWFNYKRGVDKK